MDNYTTTLADHDNALNCHIKSIVQPKEVFTVMHTHYALYKGGRFAVDEEGETIDNRNAYAYTAGRAFTKKNRNSIFRINHYKTKSLEELEEKCRRGYADGAPNAIIEDQLAPFKETLTEDYSIKPYADIVRKRMEEIAECEMKIQKG